MPRRVVDYALQFADFNRMSTIGAAILGLTQLLFLYIVIKTIRAGAKASDQVWEGARGLEWTIPSPAPLYTFQSPPDLARVLDAQETSLAQSDGARAGVTR